MLILIQLFFFYCYVNNVTGKCLSSQTTSPCVVWLLGHLVTFFESYCVLDLRSHTVLFQGCGLNERSYHPLRLCRPLSEVPWVLCTFRTRRVFVTSPRGVMVVKFWMHVPFSLKVEIFVPSTKIM